MELWIQNGKIWHKIEEILVCMGQADRRHQQKLVMAQNWILPVFGHVVILTFDLWNPKSDQFIVIP